MKLLLLALLTATAAFPITIDFASSTLAPGETLETKWAPYGLRVLAPDARLTNVGIISESGGEWVNFYFSRPLSFLTLDYILPVNGGGGSVRNWGDGKNPDWDSIIGPIGPCEGEPWLFCFGPTERIVGSFTFDGPVTEFAYSRGIPLNGSQPGLLIPAIRFEFVGEVPEPGTMATALAALLALAAWRQVRPKRSLAPTS